MHARNIRLFDFTETVGFPADLQAPTYAEDLQTTFTFAHDLKQPLRGMLADLQTIEEVMIIEGTK